MKIFCKCPTVNISKLNFWLVICNAKNFIWTGLKAIFSDSRFSNSCISAKYCPILTNHTSVESLFTNDTLSKKLNLPAGGGKCLYKSLIHSICSNGWFVQEFSKRLYEWGFESLVHTICSKRGFIQKLNTAVLLGDAWQFCYGNVFSAKVCKNT